MSKRRKFSDEFKREAVGLTRQPGVSVSQLARDLDIGAGLLGRRRRELTTDKAKAFPRSGTLWTERPKSARDLDIVRLLIRMRARHGDSDGVMGMPRMHEELIHEGETASPNRIARLMAQEGMHGIPRRRAWRNKKCGCVNRRCYRTRDEARTRSGRLTDR